MRIANDHEYPDRQTKGKVPYTYHCTNPFYRASNPDSLKNISSYGRSKIYSEALNSIYFI